VDVPLLFESGWNKRFDEIIVVTAGRRLRVQRLANRGFSPADVAKRMKAQWPLAKKVRRGDHIINNGGTKLETKRQVDEIWKKITNQKR
jgi:dephospho-CoA kinase